MDEDPFDPRRCVEHPSARALELFAAEGELTAIPEVASHVTTCSRCRLQVEAMREERAAFVARRPAARFVGAVQERATGRRSFARRSWLTALVAAACAVAFVAVDRAASPAITLKGGAPRLEVFVSRARAPAQALEPNMALRQGDVLRFLVSVPRDGYVAIANLDDRGQFTAYHAPHGKSSAIRAGTRAAIGASIELDEFVGKERIYLVYSPDALPLEQIERMVKTRTTNSTDAELAFVEIQKVPP